MRDIFYDSVLLTERLSAKMSVEDKFYAAVNVIRSLPKNGSYQPSNELMLRFYGYYKQATEGPNRGGKPAFWEVVKRAKWDAWARLANMPKHQAMAAYVDELNKIVETMAYTDNVADFLNSRDSFYSSLPADDLEMCIGRTLEKVRSQPGSPLSNSPLGSRDTSPIRVPRGPPDEPTPSPGSPSEEEEEDEEDFLDTLEQADHHQQQIEAERHHQEQEEVRESKHNKHQHQDISPDIILKTTTINNNNNITPNGLVPNGKIGSAIERAVESLHADITRINERLRKLEEKNKAMWKKRRMPDVSIPGNVVVWLVLWPVILQILIHMWSSRRRSSVLR